MLNRLLGSLVGTYNYTMILHEQLMSLYAGHWPALADALRLLVQGGTNGVKPSYPFLLSLAHWDGQPDEGWYADADLKVMVFGQETNCWYGNCDDFGTPPSPVFSPEVSMEAVMGIYEDFYASHYEDGMFKYNGRRYGTFHNGVNRFLSILGGRFVGKRMACVWNNIVKLGKAEGSGFCGDDIYEAQKQCFMVADEEVRILKPNLILFLTGTYDSRICDAWPGAQFAALPSFAVEDVAKVALPGLDIPAYRTNHPSARLPKEEKEARYEAIVNDFKSVVL